MNKVKLSVTVLLLTIAVFARSATAQTTAFTYQGKLNDGAAQANGTYDLGFALYDAETGGIQIGAAITRSNVSVVNGIFTVQLDFGAAAFPGANRFLQIAVKKTTETNFAALAPRQSVTSTPYAIRSLIAENATSSAQLGGTAANQFVQTNDARLSDSRTPVAGSNNYIQNTTTAQTSANFNVSGTGAANIFNAATQFNLGGSRILSSAGSNNFFAGIGAGSANTSGSYNSFFGTNAGSSNTTGAYNSVFGADANKTNSAGNNNAIFGVEAGLSNTSNGNSFFGRGAGYRNTTGSLNSFFGYDAGSNNTTGYNNTFVGRSAGFSNIFGRFNTFIGFQSGYNNAGTQEPSSDGINNTFVGYKSGFGNTFGDRNSYFGDSAGLLSTTGRKNTFVGAAAGSNNTSGSSNTIIGSDANVAAGDLTYATVIGAEASVSTSNTIVLGRQSGVDTVLVPGVITLLSPNNNSKIAHDYDTNGIRFTAGDLFTWFNVRNNRVNMQLDSSGTLRIVGTYNQFSDARLKNNIQTFTNALDAVRRLRGVTFNWNAEFNNSDRQIGFIAQEVETVLPELVKTDEKGFKSVAYSNAVPVLVEAVKEQQTQIEAKQTQIDALQKQIERQQATIDALKNLVCLNSPAAEICRENK